MNASRYVVGQLCDKSIAQLVPYSKVLDGVKMFNSYPQAVKTLWMTRQTRVSYPQLMSNLTALIASQLAGEPLRRIARRRCLVLLAVLCVIGITPAYGYNPNIESYKLYAHMKLLDDKQYRCLVTLWNLESRWNPKADNPKSSAYGIPQLLKMTETNPYKQIDLGLKYIHHHRIYKGNVCKALDRHKRIGHY
jgi:hypothetical protein